MKHSKLYRIIFQKLRGVNSVLDVGCGDGHLVNFLAKRTGKEIIGLDISNSGFRKATKKATQSGVPGLVRCVKCDAHQMKECFADERFEAVTITYTLHHLEDPVTVLREIREILQPNGKVLIADWIFCKDEQKGECRRFSVRDILQMLIMTEYGHLEAQELEPGLVLVTAQKTDEKGMSAWRIGNETETRKKGDI